MFAGMPTPTVFPIKSMTMEVAPPTGGPNETLKLEGQHLTDALQYGDVAGITYFVAWLHELQERVHLRKKDPRWSISVGGGSQDLITKAMNIIMDPGDSALVEAPVYGCV